MLDQMEKIYSGIKEQAESSVVVKSKMDQVKEAFSELIQLLKTPEMRKRTLNMFYSWLVVAMVYYGLSFNTKNISTDIYIPLFISGFVEVVACVVIIPALAYFGRVKVYSGTFILGGACCLSVAIILFATDSMVALTVTLAMIGKFLIAGPFALWLPETLNKKLPASVAEIEATAKGKGGKNGVEMGRTVPDMASDADNAEEQ